MKESVGGFSLFTIVIVFILIFTGYVSLSINYSKAYNVKNEIVNIIKNQGGVCTSNFDDGSICYNFASQIADYFREANYRSTHKCNGGRYGDGWIGFTRDGQLITDDSPAAFCVRGINAVSNDELPNAVYYQVRVFYQLDLPVISSIFEFSVEGETSLIYNANECSYGGYSYCWCGKDSCTFSEGSDY